MAVCQMSSVDDSEVNLQQIVELVQGLSSSVRMACFPENCLYQRIQEGDKIPSFSLREPLFAQLQALSSKKNIFLHLGSVPVAAPGFPGKAFNSSVFIRPGAELPEVSYRKIHLFDISLEGQPPMRESDAFIPGDSPQILQVEGWSFGQSICYDLRFAELYSFYSKANVDVLMVPASFLVKTGQAHWHTLLKARAIESQCYLLAPAQAGTHIGKNGSERHTFGHSLVIDPWGNIVASLESGVGVLSVSLDRGFLQKVRQQIPMSHHRKLGV